ncbi:MAG: DUF6682 family protein [Lamprobacter sp.]|uniref:phage adaptor protein n=1 Tax=Lamprobacter sp. TaxID=3100796 RepID=UPI002B2614AB|nr:DUF6682 family protein [Lamprobacter sp.]MEA3639966.1 DUF6682 family protein [Lamprobacter sp.]
MAAVKVVDLTQRAQIILQDTTGTRWPWVELQHWLNDAYREITLLRPDANTAAGTFACEEGTRQRLGNVFPNALRLIDVVRNLASSSARKAVRLIARDILDDQRRGWHAESPSVNIEHFMFDPLLPREFLVYPPASASAELEVVYSSVPTAHVLTEAQLMDPATAETIQIVDSYANAILDYILYRAYSKDAEYAANAQRAMSHREAMLASLAAKTQVDTATKKAGTPLSTT